MLSTIIGTVIGKLAAAGVAAVTVVGGAGAVGALPDPLQSVFSDAASVVGLHVPSPDHGADVEADEADDVDGVVAGGDQADVVGEPTPAADPAAAPVDEDGDDEGEEAAKDEADEDAADADDDADDEADDDDADEADDEIDADDIARCGVAWDGDSSGQGHCGDGAEENEADVPDEADDDSHEEADHDSDDGDEDDSGDEDEDESSDSDHSGSDSSGSSEDRED